jgi:hypothetical protein
MFKKHLKEAGKSYWEHFKFAFIVGFILIYAGITSIVHAIFPCFFQFTSLKIVKYLLKKAE